MPQLGPVCLGETGARGAEWWREEEKVGVTIDRVPQDDVWWRLELLLGWHGVVPGWMRKAIFQDEKTLSEKIYWHPVDVPISWSSQKHGKRPENEVEKSCWLRLAEELNLAKDQDQDQGHIIDIYFKTINKNGKPTS
jgi:hypothetical protein